MKTKNPLYVVKGTEVQEVRSILDLVIKKFNLEPALKILGKILKLIFEQVKDYPTLKAAIGIYNETMNIYMGIAKKFGYA